MEQRHEIFSFNSKRSPVHFISVGWFYVGARLRAADVGTSEHFSSSLPLCTYFLCLLKPPPPPALPDNLRL